MAADEPDTGEAPAPPTAAPAQIRAAIKARVLAASLGGAAPQRPPPSIDGRYRLLHELGRGGMGTVWAAEVLPIGKRVALKLLRGRHGDGGGRLLREARAASALRHDHIVRVDDFGIDPEAGPYLVMELLQGHSLAVEIARHAPLPWPRVAGILVQLAEALAAAHRAGIVHRDLKPANVFLVAREGGLDHCKLLDFGLCKPLAAAELDGTLTAGDMRMGTPGYMAPEQIRGEALDGRADAYALGCIAFELLTAEVPFAELPRSELPKAHLERAPPSLRAMVPTLPAAAAQLLEQLLAKTPEQRFDDLSTFASALRGLVDAHLRRDVTVPADGPADGSAAVPAASTAPRRRTAIAIVLVLMLGFGVGALGALLTQRPAPAVTDDDAAPAPATATALEAAITPHRSIAPATAPRSPPSPQPAASTPSSDVTRGAIESTPPPRRTRAGARRPTVAPAPQPTAIPSASEPTAAPAPKPTLVDGIRDPFDAL
ncbi:MAG: protein kinase [Deltaproteobacteria bacterium]|nr:protein kinase [Deltaproteobacteria bacterium]